MTWVWQNQKRTIHTLDPEWFAITSARHLQTKGSVYGRYWFQRSLALECCIKTNVFWREHFLRGCPPPPLVWASPPPPAQATAGSRRSQVAACRGKQLQMDVKGHLSISQLTSEISRHSSGRRKGKSVTKVRGSSLFSHCLPPTFYTDNDKFVLFTFPLQWTKKNWIIALGESTDTNQAHDTFFSSLSANIAQRLLLQPRIHLNRHPAEKKNNILLQSFKLFSVEFNLGNSLFWHSESSGLCCSG